MLKIAKVVYSAGEVDLADDTTQPLLQLEVIVFGDAVLGLEYKPQEGIKLIAEALLAQADSFHARRTLGDGPEIVPAPALN